MKKMKRRLRRPVVLGFLLLYLAVMGASTWFMGLKFRDEFRKNLLTNAGNLQNWAESYERYYPGQEEMFPEGRLGYYTMLVTEDLPDSTNEKFQKFSAAVYAQDGTLLTRTGDFIGGGISSEKTNGQTIYRYHELDLLTREEKEELAAYTRESLLNMPPPYRILIRESSDTKELCGIMVEEVLWEASDAAPGTEPHTDPYVQSSYGYNDGETNYLQVGETIVWEWENPKTPDNGGELRTEYAVFPYLLYGGYDSWAQWRDSEFLNDFADRIDVSQDRTEQWLWVNFGDGPGFRLAEKFMITAYTGEGTDMEAQCYIELRSESYPYLAAADYLKYMYLLGFLLMLVCMAGIIYTANRTCERQAALEEMRRDFVNAMAHELKTPLGIIRGFAENLKEQNMEEKRDYYLEQIIGQTEEMDKLAAQMIAVSRIDSEHLVLNMEVLSMSELIREQMERFAPVLEEKGLQVEYDCAQDFQVKGDREYLAKAIWNLLSNAAAYNVPGGSIRIRTKKDRCIIENTGFPMKDEELAHACDMFYRGEESRSGREEHMGLGLFLAKKILALHSLELSVENISDGVRVTIAE